MLDLLGDVQLNFVLPVPTQGSMARPNGIKFEGDPDSKAARGFQCYVKNPEINCFDFIVIQLRNDPKAPYSEYLVPITTGFGVWGQISDVVNPSITTNTLGDPKFNKNLDLMHENTPMGHRRDMLVCNNKLVSVITFKLVTYLAIF